MAKVLSFDFGASSGRAILADYHDEKLDCKEVHRFENIPIEKDGFLRWDFEALLAEVYSGIEKAEQACESSAKIDSIAFDTWGVDFGLLDENGNLIESPVHYRDKRTEGAVAKALEKMPACELYSKTGNQIMGINTLFQLTVSDLGRAKKLLFMPDLFAYNLCKNMVCEETIASTSQMFSPVDKSFSLDVMRAFGIPESIFAPLTKSGTVIGEYHDAKVIAVAGHDTQCAVAAMPSESENVAFLSCGTWSLLGTELDSPILSKDSLEMELSNEIGANGKINYLKNIIGLWLIQESRRQFKRQGQDYSYAQLELLALEAEPFACFIDPDSPEFAPTGDIPARIREYCSRTKQYVPQTVGEIMRCIYESLAMKYRYAMEQLGKITKKSFDALHILGGGTKDKLLCQMTANSINLPVIAGPIEATALGNIMIQLVALGEIESIQAGRKLIAKTQKLTTYTPVSVDSFDYGYEKYIKIIEDKCK